MELIFSQITVPFRPVKKQKSLKVSAVCQREMPNQFFKVGICIYIFFNTSDFLYP